MLILTRFLCTCVVILSGQSALCQSQDTLYSKKEVSWALNYLEFDPSNWWPVMLHGEIKITSDQFVFQAKNIQNYNKLRTFGKKISISNDLVIPIDSIVKVKKYVCKEMVIKTRHKKYLFAPSKMNVIFKSKTPVFDEAIFLIKKLKLARTKATGKN